MAQLNQIIAKVSGVKSRVQSKITEVYHKLQASALFLGIHRKYHPKDEDGEPLPDERKNVQYTASKAIEEFSEAVTELFNVVALQDRTNCIAKASVKVDGATILADVPVTTLLFLEKQLVDLHTFAGKIPTLDPAEQWKASQITGVYETEPRETQRTKKVPQRFVKYEATKEHPAQVDVFTEDVTVGTWEAVSFNGGIPISAKEGIVNRIHKLQDAVKAAREEANTIDVVTDEDYATPLLDFVFGGK